jgi:hypothetical protein
MPAYKITVKPGHLEDLIFKVLADNKDDAKTAVVEEMGMYSNWEYKIAKVPDSEVDDDFIDARTEEPSRNVADEFLRKSGFPLL